MSIKRATITSAYQINMYCDKCDSLMKYDKMESVDISINNTDEYIYKYKCTQCGHVQKSHNIYPMQQVFFNLNQLEEIDEDQIKQ